MPSHIDLILDQLEREHSGDPWHGSPLTAILHDVDATRAAQRPMASAHSIWELVLHITAWKNEVAQRTRGGKAGEPAAGDWPAVGDVTEARWRAALDALERAHADLIAAIKALPEKQLFEATNDERNHPLGTGVSYYVLLHGVIQHDVYHSGQIAILKKAT